MADKQLRVVIVGDAKSVQKAFADTATSATQAEVKVEGFGKSFLKAGVALGAGAAAVGAVVGVMHEAIGAVGDYNTAIDTATKTLLGQTKSQTETTAALAVARAEADKGRGTYQELASAMAGLSTVAKTAGLSLSEVTQTAEILAAINPEEGIKGATFALREAASGDMTSVIERFNLSRTTINKLRAEGVPAIEAVKRSMAELGYDTQFLDTANQSSAKTLEIAKGKFTELAAILGQPIFEKFVAGVDAASKAISGGGDGSFIATLTHDIQALLSGNFFDEWALSGHKAIYLLTDAFNKMLKEVSFGKLNVDDLLGGMRTVIAGEEAKIKASIDQHVAKPIADGLKGTAPGSAIAPAKVEGYGAEVFASFLRGLNSGQIGDFKQFSEQFKNLFNSGDAKADTEAFAQAQHVLAQALFETANGGQLTADTAFALQQIFGKNAAEVQALTLAYGRMGAAQEHATATTAALAQATRNLAGVQAQAKNAAEDADKAIAAAQATATQHAGEATAAIDKQQDALKGAGDAAGEAARRNQAAIDDLQAAATAHAEANAAAIKTAQDALTAATAQRQRDSDLAKAAIAGETEAYERQNDALTEQDRKLAEHYETIIGGERRAKDAADERLNGLNKAANKEDLDFLTRIKAAREQGHTKEAAALQRQFDARKKARSGEIEIARAQQAVAGDEFDTKKEQIDKEEKKRDEADQTAEKVASKRLAEVQANADAQAKADAAAIKGVQDAAKAEAERYAAQQRGIQAEIDRLTDAAKTQAAKDAAAILAAQNLKTEAALRWSIEETGAKVALGLANQIADANERTAKAAKEAYDADVARAPYAQANADNAAREAAARITAQGGEGAQGGGRDSRVTPEDISGAPLLGPPSNPGNPSTGPGTSTAAWVNDNAQRGWGPAIPNTNPPSGYHAETRPTGVWWVRDNWTLNAEGTGFAQATPGPAPSPVGGNGGSDSLGRSGTSALMADSSAPTTAQAPGDGGVTINIHAPNLTDIGNTAQQQALGTQLRQAWQQQTRSGPGRSA